MGRARVPDAAHPRRRVRASWTRPLGTNDRRERTPSASRRRRAAAHVQPSRHRGRRAGGRLRSGHGHVGQPPVVAAALARARRGRRARRRLREVDGRSAADLVGRRSARPARIRRRAARRLDDERRSGRRDRRHARLAPRRRARPNGYRGESESIDKKAGHIPGAVNHFFKWNLNDDGTFRSPEEIRARIHATIGAVAPSQLVSYCGSGVTACHNLLALEHAGLPGAKLYPGSWSEWSSDPSRPIEKA